MPAGSSPFALSAHPCRIPQRSPSISLTRRRISGFCNNLVNSATFPWLAAIKMGAASSPRHSVSMQRSLDAPGGPPVMSDIMACNDSRGSVILGRLFVGGKLMVELKFWPFMMLAVGGRLYLIHTRGMHFTAYFLCRNTVERYLRKPGMFSTYWHFHVCGSSGKVKTTRERCVTMTAAFWILFNMWNGYWGITDGESERIAKSVLSEGLFSWLRSMNFGVLGAMMLLVLNVPNTRIPSISHLFLILIV